MSRSASLFRRLSMALVFVFLYAPILVLIVFSFNDSSSRSVWAGFTLDWYRELLRDDLILDAFYTTLAVSVLAAVIATVAGTFAAIGFYNMKRRWRGPLMTINNIPMVNADIVTGVSMCLFFVAAFSLWGQAAEWINASLGTDLPTKLYLGFGTMLIAFTMSVDDFVISYFTAGSTTANLAMRIYAMTKKRISPEVNAISTLLFATVLILLIVINLREASQEKAARKLRR